MLCCHECCEIHSAWFSVPRGQLDDLLYGPGVERHEFQSQLQQVLVLVTELLLEQQVRRANSSLNLEQLCDETALLQIDQDIGIANQQCHLRL